MPGPERAPRAQRLAIGAPAVMAAAEALTLLSTGTLELLGLMPGASNYTFLARVRDGDRVAHAVYKPRDGEAPL